MNERIQKYTIFLNSLNNILEKYFNDQKDYIKCKQGCSNCCESGNFAISEIEYSYLKLEFKSLDKETKKAAMQKSVKIYKDRFVYLQQGNDIFEFTYECPLLVNNQCLLYDSRPIICRTHGLITSTYTDDEKTKQKIQFPYCVEDGLNYAEVYDNNLKKISAEKLVELNNHVTPQIYPVGYSTLLDEIKEQGHGDIRMLFEWILLDIPNYQELINKIKEKYK